MRVIAVINNNQTAWQEVSLSWNDTISQRFHTSVLTEMDSILQYLDRACEKLETETENVLSMLNRYENL
jgi:predicted 2-oxoglutarate/Fe(II)-dependent dioxygenase YbiX